MRSAYEDERLKVPFMIKANLGFIYMNPPSSLTHGIDLLTTLGNDYRTYRAVWSECACRMDQELDRHG